ncbi:hypothetical protein KUCAC02_029529, partial [Chaenocephalus aceratus]
RNQAFKPALVDSAFHLWSQKELKCVADLFYAGNIPPNPIIAVFEVAPERSPSLIASRPSCPPSNPPQMERPDSTISRPLGEGCDGTFAVGGAETLSGFRMSCYRWPALWTLQTLSGFRMSCCRSLHSGSALIPTDSTNTLPNNSASIQRDRGEGQTPGARPGAGLLVLDPGARLLVLDLVLDLLAWCWTPGARLLVLDLVLDLL